MTVELLGALILIEARIQDTVGDKGDFGINMGGANDNKGATYVVTKLYTPTEPGASIIRRLADKCLENDIFPTLTWKPRGENTWADDLSKGKTEEFSEAKRHKVNWDDLTSIQKDHESYSMKPRSRVTAPLPR